MDGRHLYERETELGMLASAWARAEAGRGGLVMVEGAAGNGKSVLVAAAAADAAATGLRVLRARGSELERGLGFGVIRQLFETVVAAAPPARRAELLTGAAAPAGRVLALDSLRDAPVPAADSGFAALHGIYWLVTNLAQAKPMLLVVDDLHWADPSSVRALAYLARRIADLPVALVVALRPDEPGTPVTLLDALRAEPAAVRIAVNALELSSVASIVRAAIPGADDALCAACFSATSGNPLYLRELLRTIAGEHQKATASMVDHAAVPTLGDGVIWRIARIGPEAVALARAMAVLDGGRLADAAALAGLGEPAAAALAALMRRIEVLARVDPVTFVHPLVRRSVYETLSVTECDAAHAAAARRLSDTGASPEAVAAHLAAVRPAGRAHVVASLRESARDAIRHAAPETAIRWLERALDEAAPRPPRAELLHELGQVELAIRSPAAIAHLREALELTAEPGPRARIALELAEILVAAGQYETALAALAGALARPGDLDPGLVVDLETFRASTQAYHPHLVGAFDADRDRLRRLARGGSWGARALAALLSSVTVLRGGDLAEARGLAEHALRDGALFAEHDAGGWASAQVLTALAAMDDDDRTLEAIEDLAAHARRSGALIGMLTAMTYRGWLAARRGDLVAAEADLRSAMEVSVQNEMPLLFITMAMFLQDVVLERPSLDDAAAFVEAAQLGADFLITLGGAMLRQTRGRLRLARGEHQGAEADLRACGDILVPLGGGPPIFFWRSELALALPAKAREEAVALVTDELRLAAATGLARAHGVALRNAGLVLDGDRGLACLRESVTRLAGSAARLEYARSLVEYGAALRRRGERARAREPLAGGMELAYRCGAGRLVVRAREELRVAGARPRRISRSGVEALTASELRTARLAAAGRSNAEVAQELFVSLKTVETHLSHAYAKLGLTGPGARRQLSAVLG
jgi:DNA-binding CsgD family transcriptional regulator/tetratricopeptide (TPR) repeat protein